MAFDLFKKTAQQIESAPPLTEQWRNKYEVADRLPDGRGPGIIWSKGSWDSEGHAKLKGMEMWLWFGANGIRGEYIGTYKV